MDNRKQVFNDRSISPSKSRTSIFGLLVIVAIQLMPLSGQADQPQRIWSPALKASTETTLSDECCFRKRFTLLHPEKGELEFDVDGRFKISINGQLVDQGEAFGHGDRTDVSSYLEPGVNLIAIWVQHREHGTPGLAVRFRVKEKQESRWRVLLSDQTWRAQVAPIADWISTTYDDRNWGNARLFESAPFDQDNQTAATTISPANESDPSLPPQPSTLLSPVDSAGALAAPHQGDLETKQIEVASGFRVESVLESEKTGSLIAMEFTEFGKLLISREGGPLLIADLTKALDDDSRIRVYCDEVRSCQGILPLNGEVFVTAVVKGNLGLYRLADTNEDGMLEVTQKLVGFTGDSVEFGPHGIQLGPDGMLYVVLGHQSQVEVTLNSQSPYRSNDAGGRVIRISQDGSKIESVAGGIRNACDLVFNSFGELFVHDRGTESDHRLIGHQSSTVFHVPAGAELGWRSGGSMFSNSLVDQTPGLCETGPGSPSGATLYQHIQFPTGYHNTIFLADRSGGNILALRTEPEGAGFTATTEMFLKSQSLNVVDVAVGQDGALYFCANGQGDDGGVFRIVWNGETPPEFLEYESDLAHAIRHPQPQSAWARQEIAQLKADIGEPWGRLIEGVAKETRNSTPFRLSALNLMVLYGPGPSQETITTLASDEVADIRAKIAQMCGMNQNPINETLLFQLVLDPRPRVRRIACESCRRLEVTPELSALLAMLDSNDRLEAGAARQLLEQIPPEKWESLVLSSNRIRVFTQGAIALMVAHPNLERAYEILAKSSQWMDGFVNDHDFISLLRAMELALVRGQVNASQVPGLVERIANEFPSRSSTVNRQLIPVMAHLKVAHLNGRIEAFLLDPTIDVADKTYLARSLQTSDARLTDSEDLAILETLRTAKTNTAKTEPNVRIHDPSFIDGMITEETKRLEQNHDKIGWQVGHSRPAAIESNPIESDPIELDSDQ